MNVHHITHITDSPSPANLVIESQGERWKLTVNMLSESSEPNTINICSNSKWTVEGYSQWCSLPECFRSGKSGAGWTSQSDWSYCCTRSWHSQRLPWWDCRERKRNQANENSIIEIFFYIRDFPEILCFLRETSVTHGWALNNQLN